MIPLQIIVATADAAAGARMKASVGGQAWKHVRVIHPVGKAVAEARASGSLIALFNPGATLLPLALECAWWALETRSELAFVALGDERGSKTPMLDAIAAGLVVRAHAIDDSESTIALAISLIKKGGKGQLIREPLVIRNDEMRAADSPIGRATANLRGQGLTDVQLGDTTYDPPPPELPQQAIDEGPLPENRAPQPLKSGQRILALLQGFPLGGYTAFNADFLPRLAEAGHALTVCTSEIFRTDWKLEQVRAAVPDLMHAQGIAAYPSLPRYLSYLIESRQIEVVLLSHAFNAYRLLPWLRARHPKTAFVDYVHTDWFEPMMYGSYAAIAAAHAPWLDVQVATSEALAKELIQRGAAADSTRAISINLDVAEWDPARYPGAEVRGALGCKTGQPLVLYAGRVSNEKRPLLAVAIWKALAEAGVDARFAVAGSGPLLPQMQKAVAEAGLKARVAFLGELDAASIRHVYAAADVFHAPSEIEGIARSLFEAMAMECVPVVALVGGQGELVDERCGFLIPHGANEIQRYVEALKKATSPELQPILAKAARLRIASHFTSGQCVAAFGEVFAAALKKRLASSLDSGNPLETKELAAAARELAISGLEISRRHFWHVQWMHRAQRAEAAEASLKGSRP